MNAQALEAAHPRLAPLREKYGLMAGTLARSNVSQGGTPPMAASMMTLHLIGGGGDGAASAKYSKPVPGDGLDNDSAGHACSSHAIIMTLAMRVLM